MKKRFKNLRGNTYKTSNSLALAYSLFSEEIREHEQNRETMEAANRNLSYKLSQAKQSIDALREILKERESLNYTLIKFLGKVEGIVSYEEFNEPIDEKIRLKLVIEAVKEVKAIYRSSIDKPTEKPLPL